jgi:hypothetical protein
MSMPANFKTFLRLNYLELPIGLKFGVNVEGAQVHIFTQG